MAAVNGEPRDNATLYQPIIGSIRYIVFTARPALNVNLTSDPLRVGSIYNSSRYGKANLAISQENKKSQTHI